MKPRNHGTYQIWHDGTVHVADVESVGVREVERLTAKPPKRWHHHPAVTLHAASPRSTRPGDVIVDPTCGAWKVEPDGYLVVRPPPPVAERIEREGIVPQHIEMLNEWLSDMKAALAETEKPHGVGWTPRSQKIICVPRVAAVCRQIRST